MKARGGGRAGADDRVSLEDTRRVPAREGRGEVREKASRFFGIAELAATPRAAEEFLEALRREHHDATHVAYAWRCGAPGSESLKSSDDGEPSGTAGRPIAAAISSAGLTDVVVAVVRFYGGTKLGTGGLARAYRQAANLALAGCGSATVYETVILETRPPHARVGVVRRLIDPPHVRLRQERFDPEPVLELEVRRSLRDAVQERLSDERIPYQLKPD